MHWTDAMAAGDCAAVIAALAEPREELERLAAATCLERSGQDGRALEVLGGFEGAIAPYAALVRARALLDRDRAADAVLALEGVSLPGPEEELVRGRALVGAGQDARAVLRPLLETPVKDEALWWLAQGAERRGEKDAAVEALRSLWTKSPTSAWAARAADRLAALGAPVPDYDTEPGRALALSRAKQLLALRQAGDAVPLLDAVHTRVPFATQAERLYMAEALFDARLYPRAAEWYARAGADTHGPAAAFSQALATARTGDYDTAATRYAALAARWPDAKEADEATWKPAWMDYDAARFEQAEAGFTAYLRARPDGRFVSEARWFRAWSAYRRGVRDPAGFEEVMRLHPGTEVWKAARYWRARVTDDAAALRDIARETSSYGWFASQRLEIRYPAATLPAPVPFDAAFLAARPDLATGVRLAEAGFAEWARPLLLRYRKEAPALPLARALVAAEDYTTARALAKSSCALAPDLCTPRPHAGAVASIAKARGLDPLLPYAIMNAESGLDPSVTSPAGARGLMQLMPALAVELARDVVAGFQVDDLYRAGVNARLGTTELSLLHARYSGGGVRPSLPLVIAGYNGGADAVDRWLKAYPTAPEADRFAEDISFNETRRYVRRVLGYLMEYRKVYGDG